MIKKIFWLKFEAQILSAFTLIALVNAMHAQAQTLSQQPYGESSLRLETLSSESAYTLDTGDVIFVEIFGLPDYSREYQILSDGTVSLPLIGPLQVRGMTIEQASVAISSRYATYIRRPFISVELRQTRPIQVAIAGEVNRPGSYLLPAEDDGTVPTVTQAIQLAGGITQIADIRSVHVRRAGVEDDVIRINLWSLIRDGELDQDVKLQDGDSIIVPEAQEVSPEESLTTASASFSPNTIRVNVVGEVVSPGTLEVPPNIPFNQALLAAGGFNRRAARNTVTLVRLNADGTVSQRAVEVDFEQGINDNTNPTLRNGDTLVIRRSGLASFTDTLGSVLSPVSGAFSILRLLGLD